MAVHEPTAPSTGAATPDTAAAMRPLAVTAHTMASALGRGVAPARAALAEGRSGLRRQRFETCELDAWLGLVDGLDDEPLPAPFEAADCRNHRLAWAALQCDGFMDAVAAARSRHGAHRVGVFLGTSTSGILTTEIAYRHRDAATGALPPTLHFEHTHDLYALARFVREALALQGPAATVSTACSSGAKVWAMAARLIDAGLIDAAVVGGADSMCLTTLHGFHALELLSPDITRPWDARRAGLSLGEAAGFALLEREPAPGGTLQGWMLGCGESSDGHHISSPHPEGAGAVAAMRQALAQAGLQPEHVDHLNLHGTGTPNNDASEDRAVMTVFGSRLPVSSTKGATGHALGAAGALEAGLSLLALQQGLMPANLNLLEPDPSLQARIVARPTPAPLRVVASNSFGFGGSNACLILGQEPLR